MAAKKPTEHDNIFFMLGEIKADLKNAHDDRRRMSKKVDAIAAKLEPKQFSLLSQRALDNGFGEAIDDRAAETFLSYTGLDPRDTRDAREIRAMFRRVVLMIKVQRAIFSRVSAVAVGFMTTTGTAIAAYVNGWII